MTRVTLSSQNYKVEGPDKNWVILEVDGFEYTELKYWYWNGVHGRSRAFRPSVDQEYMATVDEIWSWLRDEEELVQLRAIGPEDREYFINDERLKELLS